MSKLYEPRSAIEDVHSVIVLLLVLPPDYGAFALLAFGFFASASSLPSSLFSPELPSKVLNPEGHQSHAYVSRIPRLVWP